MQTIAAGMLFAVKQERIRSIDAVILRTKRKLYFIME